MNYVLDNFSIFQRWFTADNFIVLMNEKQKNAVNMINICIWDLLVGKLHPSHLAGVLYGQLDGGVVHQLADLQGPRVVIRFASQGEKFEQRFNLIEDK